MKVGIKGNFFHKSTANTTDTSEGCRLHSEIRNKGGTLVLTEGQTLGPHSQEASGTHSRRRLRRRGRELGVGVLCIQSPTVPLGEKENVLENDVRACDLG